MRDEIKARIAQINAGIAPAGYKKTKVGIVPEEWETKALGQVLTRVSNAVDVEPETMYTQIGIRSHGNGLFYKEPVSGEELGNKSVFWIEPGCFILNIVFAWEQAIGKTTEQEVGMIASHRFPMYKPNDLDIDYLVFYLLTKRGTVLLDLASPGGAGRNRTLGQEHFLKSKVPLPPLPEQQKIAEILTAQDAVIALLQKQIELLQKQKKAFLQKMFPKKGSTVPEIRFAGFTDAWERRKLGEVLSLLKDGTHGTHQNSDEGVYLLSAKNIKNGQIVIDEETDRKISVEEFETIHSNFKLKENDVLLTIVGSIGETAILKNPDTATFQRSVAFLRPNEDTISIFLKTEIETDIFQKELSDRKSQSAQPGVYLGELEKIPFYVTSIQEQEKIGAFFSNLDSLITLHQRKLEIEQQKKKALMQLLLSGKVRVES